MHDSLERSLGSAYRLDRELPAGGMARVFVATEVALGRTVVVKVQPDAGGDDARGQRFRREIQLAAALQHPAIVPLYAAGGGEGVLWYVMPYVEGASLRDRLAQAGALPAAEAVRLWRDLLEALACAHERGVVHRDIKPENILLSGGRAVVTDFGVAKALDAAHAAAPAGAGGALTTVGIALGTPAYMAPEQALADPAADHRVDLYAAGLVLYEMLSGRTPFTGPTPQAVMAAHLTQPPPPLEGVAPALAALVMRCLAKEAGDRPASARAVLDALDAITGSGEAMRTPDDGAVRAADGAAPRTADARATASPGRTRSPWRRRALVAGALLAVAAGGAWGFRRQLAQRFLAPPVPGFALLADVTHAPGDSAIAAEVTEALGRTIVGTGKVIVPDRGSLRGVGALLGIDSDGGLDASSIREVLARTGVKAAILTRVAREGDGVTIDISVSGGVPDTLLFRVGERAERAGDVREVAEHLGRTVRAKLEDIAPLLPAPTRVGMGRTRSAEAATLLADANDARSRGDRDGFISLAKAAVAADPWYAEAWRTLHIAYLGTDRAASLDAIAKAYAVRDSGGVIDRLMIEGMYWSATQGVDSLDRVMKAYRGVIAFLPAPMLSVAARHNLALALGDQREFVASAAMYASVVDTASDGRPRNGLAFNNRLWALLRQQRGREVDSLVARAATLWAGRRMPVLMRSMSLVPMQARVARDTLRRALEAVLADSGRAPAERAAARAMLSNVARSQGRLDEADRLAREGETAAPVAGASQARAARAGRDAALFRGDIPRAVRTLDSLERSPEYAALDPRNRPYLVLAEGWLAAGDARRAQAILDQRARDLGPAWSQLDDVPLSRLRADLASARRDGAEAVRLARRGDRGACLVCGLPALARAYEAAGRPDSAIAILERYLVLLDPSRTSVDQVELPRTLRRLGELHEAAGHVPQAVARYRDFVALWDRADAPLQPAVREVRERITRLLARKG